MDTSKIPRMTPERYAYVLQNWERMSITDCLRLIPELLAEIAGAHADVVDFRKSVESIKADLAESKTLLQELQVLRRIAPGSADGT